MMAAILSIIGDFFSAIATSLLGKKDKNKDNK